MARIERTWTVIFSGVPTLVFALKPHEQLDKPAAVKRALQELRKDHPQLKSTDLQSAYYIEVHLGPTFVHKSKKKKKQT